MDANTFIAWGTFFGIVLGIYNVVKQIRRDKKKQPLDDYKSAIEIAQAASDTVKNFQKEMNELKLQVADLKKANDRKDKLITDWAIGIRKLIAQMKGAGIIPCWEPEQGDK